MKWRVEVKRNQKWRTVAERDRLAVPGAKTLEEHGAESVAYSYGNLYRFCPVRIVHHLLKTEDVYE